MMADAAVEFFIEKLKQLLIHRGHLFPGADHEVEKLDDYLLHFKASIGDAPKQQSKRDELLTEPIGRIRLAVYGAEDAIDAHITLKNPVNIVFSKRRKETLKQNSAATDIVVRTVKEIGAALEQIRCIYSKNNTADSDSDSDVEDWGTGEIQERLVKEQNAVVALEDKFGQVVADLMEESSELQVLSIIGMGGLGKTVLAQRVFYDTRIVKEFPIRIWVYISQAFTEKEVFLHILSEFVVLSDDIKRRTDRELADLVATFLRDDRFLLVMDDLWEPRDWDKLVVALPITNKMGRVLITSRQEKVGRYVNRGRRMHRMRFLTIEESIKLLQLEANCGKVFPPELEREGQLIAEKCAGLPLAIVLIGGILVKEFSSDIQTMKATWNKVYKSLKSIMFHDETMERMAKVIAMCCENIPYRSRECLVYFGMFPEDFEISIWKLIRLWIAEGFIQQNPDVSLEETAENYLQELIDRNLVRGVKFKLDGKVKTCRVHDMILDFCIDQAARDGFYQQIKKSNDGGFQPPVDVELKFRRLCIHSHALNFLLRKPNGPSVRSFIYSSREEMAMPMKDLSTIPKGFKLLRVLDVEPINFEKKLPRDLFQLLHLKYLFLSVKVDVLPSAFSHLLNIQTLVFNTIARTLEVRADILNLAQLRHFKTKASAALPETSTSSATAGENFQTLASISPESCTKDVFDRARNLKKLGIRGNLASLLDWEKGSFDSLGKLEDLENLKLLYDVYPIPPSGLPMLSLPPPHKFPPKLKILTLSRTCLDWRHMSTIESLENLEVLKLENKAFVGQTWEVNHGGFRRLEALRIERMNLKIWLVYEDQFPKLKHLQLRHCDDLQQVPIELADVKSFVKLDLFHCKRAAASAREIEAKIKYPDNDEREFSLSISPFS